MGQTGGGATQEQDNQLAFGFSFFQHQPDCNSALKLMFSFMTAAGWAGAAFLLPK